MRGEQKAEGSSGEREVCGVRFGAACGGEASERADEEAERGERERKAEEAERLRVQVQEVAHAEGVVAGVLGEELWRGRCWARGRWVWRRK